METFLKVLVLLVGILLVGIFVWEGLRRLKVWRIRKWGVKTLLQMSSGDTIAEHQNGTDESESLSTQENSATSGTQKEPVDTVLNLYIESKSSGFLAYSLFNLLEKSGLIFNEELNVFEAKNEQGEVDYYITSAVAPGVFDLKNTMTSIPAVSLFARPDLQTNPRISFFKLLEGTHKIASELGGRVLNMRREVLTEESVSADYLSVVETYSVGATVNKKEQGETEQVKDHQVGEHENHVEAKDQHVAS
ncbi:cell division protein ZipA C-terminal FtsZ-binding domain-containing protein [Piscirickettsia litoralis]|uniref:Cell division protein ZipA n=1 Tax=Piscirickettsia litoralis TaxID=1891921 RepID=A0ABX3A061_9GAMM|nr:cell division protein ZipA C-terminal FtsZ-binding domain-containing protein [Piscirickettsia litoralis]ODN42251.1 cell division protein FtsZ [Piscirickettsia litoralis]